MDDLLDNAPCGFLTFADDGTILLVNTTLRRWLGYEPEELPGRHIGSLLAAGGRIFYQTHFFPLLKLNGKAEEIYLSLQTRTGESLPVLVNAVRRTDATPPVNCCVFIPIRQRSRYEDEILQAKRTAEEATRALSSRVEREASVNRISQALRGSTDPGAIQAVALKELGQALEADRCYFVQYDMARNRASIAQDWHAPHLASLAGVHRVSDFSRHFEHLYRHQPTLVLEDIETVENAPADRASEQKPLQDADASTLRSLGIRSGIGVALYENDIPVAALIVGMANQPRPWTEAEIRLVQIVATLTRTAMDEARIREREHRIAERLQEALRPALPGQVPGLELDACYQPALDEAEIGGDFFDVFAIEKGCYALVVADLSGKGLAAAAQIATVRHMLRTLLYQRGTTLAQAVTQLNEMLAEQNLLTGFATLFVGIYDVNQRTLTYVSCGQEPALLWRAADGTIEELSPTGRVLGAFAEAIYEERVVSMASGDILAIFTDGLTEARTAPKQLLEIDGVRSIFQQALKKNTRLSVEEIVADIMAGVEAAALPDGIRDDVCLLVACIQ
jgi:PAS domain S-box-containing protein